jgi:CHAD domain-containing protein
MTPHPIHYLLPEGWSLDDLKGKLAESNQLVEADTHNATFTYLDSFDWRLWQAGAELVFEEQPHGSRLCWIDRRAGQLEESLPLGAPPDFPNTLPKGALRKRLGLALEMRVLLPVVKVEQQSRILALLNDDDKTVLRLLLQSNRFSSLDGKVSGELESRVQLAPVKGYPKSHLQMQGYLDSLGLEPESQSLFEAALTGIERRPMDYSSKLNYLLDPEARSDQTAKQILLSLLNTLEANVEGTKANLDSEFLHDLRVATRRSRSAMSQIKGVFEEEELAPLKKGLAWLGQATGPTRDMDVYLLKYKDYRKSLPAKVRKDLDPFHDFLLAHHKQAQQELERQLNSPHFCKLMKSYRTWLEAPVPNVSFQPNAVRPIAALADQRIIKIYKKVLKDGKAIQSDTHAEALHDLRKDCKKLRYLMEFFQSLYPKPEIRGLIAQLKALLDNLGDFQDLQVQAEALEAFGEQMQKEGAPASCLMAMGILVGNLLQRQEQARVGFADLFAQFSTEENDQSFKKLFGGN